MVASRAHQVEAKSFGAGESSNIPLVPPRSTSTSAGCSIVLNFDSAKPISVALLATLIPTSIGSKFLEHPLEACTSPIRLLRFRVAAFELF